MGQTSRDSLPLGGAGYLDPASSTSRTFNLAALSARFIGVAAIALGIVSLYSTRQLPAGSPRGEAVVFAAMFILPGLLYLLLASWVARQRRWAVLALLALAMLDVALLGALFVTSLAAEGARLVCVLAACFVVALVGLSIYLGRCLVALKRLGPGPINPLPPSGR